jgi:hypothetical protein
MVTQSESSCEGIFLTEHQTTSQTQIYAGLGAEGLGEIFSFARGPDKAVS